MGVFIGEQVPVEIIRQARWGKLPTGDASRLASILQVMKQCLEASDLERRLELMEKAIGDDTVVPFKPKLVK